MKAKRILYILLIAMLVLGMQPRLMMPVSAAGTPDILVTAASTAPANLYEDTDFTLQLTYMNVSGHDLTGVMLDFSVADDVTVRSGGSVVPLIDTLHADTPIIASIPLRYTGSLGNDRIPVRFIYTDTGVQEDATAYIYINAMSTVTPPDADTSKYKPMLRISVIGSNTANAGESTELRLQIQNTGNLYSACNIYIEEMAGADNPSAFTSVGFIPAGLIPEIRPGASIELKMTINTDLYAVNGYVLMPVRLSFTNSWSDAFTMDGNILISVMNPNRPARISLENQITDPSEVKYGSAFNLAFTVFNAGTFPAKDIKITLDGLTADIFTLASGSNRILLSSLDGGRSYVSVMKLLAGSDIKTGSYPLNFRIEYSDERGNKTTDEQQLWIPVKGVSEVAAPDDPTKDVPRIMVKSYIVDPSIVNAGETFKLSLEFLNTHQSKTISNIKATLMTVATSEAGNVFTPVGSGNTFFIDRIAPKAAVQREISLYAIPDAQAKTHIVTINFEYQDTAGNPFKSDEIIGIPVYQPSRFEISEPNLPFDVQAGMPVYVSFEMYNLGKNVLYNVKMRIEGVESQPKSAYYGNFESGHNEYVELNITPMEAGSITGRIIVSYETSSGEADESVKEFTMNVAEIPIITDDGGMIGPDGKPIDGGGIPIGPDGNPLPDGGSGFFRSTLFIILASGLGLAAAAAVIFLVIRKRSRAKGIAF